MPIFLDAFQAGAASGFTLVLEEYHPNAAQPWSIALRKHDNHHVAMVVFEIHGDAEAELLRFPQTAKLAVVEITSKQVSAYLKLMNEITGNAVLALVQDRNKKISLLSN